MSEYNQLPVDMLSLSVCLSVCHLSIYLSMLYEGGCYLPSLLVTH